MGALEAVIQMRQMEQQKAMQERALQEEIMNNAIGNIMNATKLQQNQAMMGLEKQKTQASIDSLVGETKAKQQQQDLLNQLIGGEGGQAGKPYIEGLNIGGMNVKIPKSQEQIQTELNIKQQEENVKNKADAQKNLDTYTSDAIQSLNALDKIGTQAEKLGNFKRGLWGQGTAKMSMGMKDFSKDENVTRYKGVVSQELIPMARKLMEEKGPITESDVSRLEKGFGDLTTPLEDKKFLLNQFKDKVKQALSNKAQVAGLSEEEFSNKYPDLYKKAYGENSSNQSLNFSSESEVNKANLPKGTIIFINGRKARVD